MLCILQYFRNHKHGSLNIYNSPNVIVKDCKFLNNTSDSFFTRKRFQGSSGGLSIGYNANITSLNSAKVLVTNCNFTNNKAIAPPDLYLSTTDFLVRNIYSGRGGGLSMPINALWPLNIVINSSTFVNNYAENYGGGLFFHILGNIINQTYLIENNIFSNNSALIGSGAINFGNFGSTVPFSTLHNTIYNCTFENNSAQKGGSLHIVPSYPGLSDNFIRITKCLFRNNTSTKYGIIDVSSFNYYKTRQHYQPVHFTEW